MLVELNAYSDIAQKIEKMVTKHNIDYMDAIISYCESHNLELEVIGEIISKIPTLKSKIQLEAEELHFIKPTSRLPL